MMNKVFILLCSTVMGYFAAPAHVIENLKGVGNEAVEIADAVGASVTIKAKEAADLIVSGEEELEKILFQTLPETVQKAEHAVENYAVESVREAGKVLEGASDMALYFYAGFPVAALVPLTKEVKKEVQQIAKDISKNKEGCLTNCCCYQSYYNNCLGSFGNFETLKCG